MALNIRGEGISRGVEGCPALLPADNILMGGGWGVDFPGHSSGYPSSADPVANDVSRNSGDSPP